MSKRRSLNDALSPEQRAFMDAGEKAEPNADPPSTPVKHDFDPREILTEEVLLPVDRGLVTLNTRIDPDLMSDVMRASMIRKIKRMKPSTQRDIVSEALEDWLVKAGFRSRN